MPEASSSIVASHQTGVSSSAVRRTASSEAPDAASVAAITAPSTTGALQTTTRARRRLGQHLDRHLAVGLRAAEVDQNGDAAFRPRPIDRRHDRLDAGAEPAAGIAAAPAKRHFVRRPSARP